MLIQFSMLSLEFISDNHQSKLTLAVEHQLFNILLSIEMFHFIYRNLVQFPLKLAAMHTHTHTHKNVLWDDLNEI